MSRGKAISGKVLDYLIENENIIVTLTGIMKATELTRTQVFSTLSNLRIRHGVNIETVTKGGAWIYKGMTPVDSKGRLFEFLAETKKGTLLIQDEEGTIYKASKVD